MLYVVTDAKGQCLYGQSSTNPENAWPLPQENSKGGWDCGEWTAPVKGRLGPTNGYTLIRPKAVIRLLGPTVYQAHYRMDVRGDGAYLFARSAKLLKPTKWNWKLGAEWIASRVETVISTYVGKHHKLAKEAMKIFNEYINYKPKPLVEGNLHELNNYENMKQLHGGLLNMQTVEIHDAVGKAPAEAYRLGAVATWSLLARDSLFTESAVVALDKCLPRCREMFLRELLDWRIKDAEDRAVVELIKAQPKGDFTIPRSNR